VSLSVGVSRQGVEFDAADGGLVYLVFLVLAGLQNPGLNVQVLADIGNLVQIPGVYEQLTSVPDVNALVQVIQKVLV
jgi:mannitol/fructose-specific phosphotransferase system IIA component (Ntr-type)